MREAMLSSSNSVLPAATRLRQKVRLTVSIIGRWENRLHEWCPTGSLGSDVLAYDGIVVMLKAWR